MTCRERYASALIARSSTTHPLDVLQRLMPLIVIRIGHVIQPSRKVLNDARRVAPFRDSVGPMGCDEIGR